MAVQCFRFQLLEHMFVLFVLMTVNKDSESVVTHSG